jgi:1,4-alpha-glucan branching enzyme
VELPLGYGSAEVRPFSRDHAFKWLQQYRGGGLRRGMPAFIRNIYGKDIDPSDDISKGWRLMQQIDQEMNDLKTHIEEEN